MHRFFDPLVFFSFQELGETLLQEAFPHKAPWRRNVTTFFLLLICFVAVMFVSIVLCSRHESRQQTMQASTFTMAIVWPLGNQNHVRLGHTAHQLGFGTNPSPARLKGQKGKLLTSVLQNDRIDPMQNNVTPPSSSIVAGPAVADFRKLRTKLLEIASSIRGLAISEHEVKLVHEAARKLQNCRGVNMVDWTNDDDVAMMDGMWRILLASGFAWGSGLKNKSIMRMSRALQRIRIDEDRLDNIFTPLNCSTTVEFNHDIQLFGKAGLRIFGDSTTIEPFRERSISLQTISKPFTDEVRALLPESMRESIDRDYFQALFSELQVFRITYLDDKIRIMEGESGELRVFVRD